VNDTWTLSLSGTPTWAPLPTVGSPPPRILHKAAYDSANQRMLIMGGWDGMNWRNTTFALTLTGTSDMDEPEREHPAESALRPLLRL
jgi:hypothetical protein